MVLAAQPAQLVEVLAGAVGVRVHHDQLGHVVEPLVGGVGHEPEHVQAVQGPMRDVQVQVRPPVRPVEQRRVDVGHQVVVAGREQDQVDLLLAAVGEDDRVLAQFADVRLGHQVAVREVVQHLGVHDRVRLKQRWSGAGSP